MEAFTYDTFGNELTYKKITKQGEDTIKIERSRKYTNTSKWVSLSSYQGEKVNVLGGF
jgi:endo-1,4-beta-mannosidase